MSPSFDVVKQRIATLVASFKNKAVDGLTWLELFAFLRELVAELMAIVAQFDAPGEDKRKLVLQAVAEVLDYVLVLVSFPGLPWWLRLLLTYAGPALKAFLLNQADLWLEQNYLAKYKLAA